MASLTGLDAEQILHRIVLVAQHRRHAVSGLDREEYRSKELVGKHQLERGRVAVEVDTDRASFAPHSEMCPTYPRTASSDGKPRDRAAP